MNKTSISYADFTFNPLLGCSHASTGCLNCYAERLASTRLAHLPAYQGLTEKSRWNGKVRLLPERLNEPLRRKKPAVIFVGDMGDLFHPGVPFGFIAAIFGVMAACPQHTFLLLTKRPERMLEFMRRLRMGEVLSPRARCDQAAFDAAGIRCRDTLVGGIPEAKRWPLPNVWSGVTVENQEQADRRIPLLLKTPAAHRWVSCEPLLGPMDLRRWMTKRSDGAWLCCECCHKDRECGSPWHVHRSSCKVCNATGQHYGLDGLVLAGESGPKARPCDVEWIRSLRYQCAGTGTKCYVKQITVNGRCVQDSSMFPLDLQVRELAWT